MKINGKTTIFTIWEDDGLSELPLTWSQWKSINEDGFDESEFAEIEAALNKHGEYRGGGGASPIYTLRIPR